MELCVGPILQKPTSELLLYCPAPGLLSNQPRPKQRFLNSKPGGGPLITSFPSCLIRCSMEGVIWRGLWLNPFRKGESPSNLYIECSLNRRYACQLSCPYLCISIPGISRLIFGRTACSPLKLITCADPPIQEFLPLPSRQRPSR